MRVLDVALLLFCIAYCCTSSYLVDFPDPVQNDDFCDLKSGIDESLTSACSHLRTKFACPASNGIVVTIPTSRVNDGVCDCCDGSDEKNNIEETVNRNAGARLSSSADSWNVQCINTCEDSIVSHRNTIAEAVLKKVTNTIDNKMSVKQARRERYEKNRPKREAKTPKNKKSLYARVKRKLTMVFLYTALVIALLIPLCYCLCCVPAVTNLLEVGMYKFRMLVLFLFQRFGMSSVKTSYTLRKDATNMV